MYTKIHYKFPDYLLNLQKLFEMGPSMFITQLETPRYHSTNSLAGLNLNIHGNMTERFRLIELETTLHIHDTSPS
jgi:hypothetical protein